MHLSKIKKIVYVVCSLMLLLFLIVYINKEHIFNAACKREDFRTVLVQNLYDFTEEQLRGNGFNMFVILGKSITKSELYYLFDSNKEATVKAMENAYQLKDFHGFPLSKILKLNNIAYTLIFPSGDGGYVFCIPI